MKKYRAKQLMMEGQKITHVNFTDEEWMTIKDGKILLEDGVRCSQAEFWKWRKDESWNEGHGH